MIVARLPYYAALVLAILFAGYGLAVSGLAACAPTALPGETAWVWKERLWSAAALAFGDPAACFLPSGYGRFAVAAAVWTSVAVLGLLVAFFLWEALGRALLARLGDRRGGHVVIAGEPEEVDSLDAEFGRTAAVFIARDRASALRIAARRPFGRVGALEDRRRAAPLVARAGAASAATVVCATLDDLLNGELAEAALKAGGKAALRVRLENGAVRALKGDALRRDARKAGRAVSIVSLDQMQSRQALQLAMPGRYVDEAAERIHVAVCGAGPRLQDMAFLVARQGYGWERAQPLLTVLRTGRSDFSIGALQRLDAADAIELRAENVDGEDTGQIDRAVATLALGAAPLSAIHCCEERAGDALALALRIERVFVDLDQPVPPIVVHGAGPAEPGDTGMIRIVDWPTLAHAFDAYAALDDRARAFHAAYLDGQRRAQGAAFGALPAEREWDLLPEEFRDDNRAPADHADYKLALAGLRPVAGRSDLVLSAADLETLAAAEHARWMARRSVGGWRYGAVRDNHLLLHPDMKAYPDLDPDARRKDREQVMELPAHLARAGEGLARLKPVAVLSPDKLDAALAGPGHRSQAASDRLMIAVALDSQDGILAGEAALAAGYPIEVFVAKAPEQAFDDKRLAARAAIILRRAWCIRAVRGRPAREALAVTRPVVAGADGVVA